MGTEGANIRWNNLSEFSEQVLRPNREQLGLKQTAMARRIGVHQSRISRIEQGQGKPKDIETAKKYAWHYGLSEEQTQTWLKLLFGITTEASPSYTDFLQLYSDTLDSVYLARVQGLPRLSIKLADNTAHSIRETIQKTTSSSSKDPASFLTILFRLLYQKTFAYYQFVSLDEIWRRTIPIEAV